MAYQTRDFLRQRIVPPVDRSLGADGADAPNPLLKSQTTQMQTGGSDPNVGKDATGSMGTGGIMGTGGSGGVSGTKGGQLTYAQLYEQLNQRQEPTPEEKRRERRAKMFASIGDGISALSNLYFTSKGAPNMYSPQQSQSRQVADYWDRIRQDRENNRRRYVDGYIKAAQADDLAAIRKQNAEAQQAAKEAEAKRKDELAEAQGAVFKARATKDAAATALSEKTLEYMNSYGWPLARSKTQAEIDLAKARAGQAEASAAKSRASSGGKSGSGKKYYGTFNGVAYKTKADYDKAVVSYAKGNKIPLTYDKVSTDEYGMRRMTKTNRTVAGLASEGEARYRSSHAVKPAVKAAPKPTARVVPKPAVPKAAPTVKKTYAHTKQLGL